jgi:copper chaperone CopZ
MLPDARPLRFLLDLSSIGASIPMNLRLVLLCATILMCSACDQPRNPMSVESPSTPAGESTPAAPQLVSLKVDGMTCPSGCYPSVRSAIAKQKGVLEVELAPQKEKDVIDNPVVFVKYKGDLDLDAMFKAIERAGFEAEALPN